MRLCRVFSPACHNFANREFARGQFSVGGSKNGAGRFDVRGNEVRVP
jgi:hypothetical protein